MGTRRPLKVIGQSPRKVDGMSKCTGTTKFADDLSMPRMLFCKLHRSHVAHAKIVSIDVSKALELEGVYGTITGDEVAIQDRKSVV